MPMTCLFYRPSCFVYSMCMCQSNACMHRFTSTLGKPIRSTFFYDLRCCQRRQRWSIAAWLVLLPGWLSATCLCLVSIWKCRVHVNFTMVFHIAEHVGSFTLGIVWIIENNFFSILLWGTLKSAPKLAPNHAVTAKHVLAVMPLDPEHMVSCCRNILCDETTHVWY